MIELLHIKDIALIEKAWIELGPGLNVITGETGAGKTVLLGALQLILGKRAELSMIRNGADKATVEAQFSDGVVATRTISTSGKNRITLNDGLITVGALAAQLGPRIDLHGQHDHQKLLRPSTHEELLDTWAGSDTEQLGKAYRHAYRAFRDAELYLEQIQDRASASSDEIELGRIMLEEIDRISPQAEEDDRLQGEISRMQHGEELSQALQSALIDIRSETGAATKLAQAHSSLQRVTDFDAQIADCANRLTALVTETEDIGMVLGDLSHSCDYSEAQLEEALTRLHSIDGLKKRFGPSLAMVLSKAEQLRRTQDVVADSTEIIERAKRELDRAKAKVVRAASLFHDSHKKAAMELSARLTEGVRDLDMKRATFEVRCDCQEFEHFSSTSPDSIEIFYRPAETSMYQPLAKIASGGEISRVMLALKSVVGNADDVEILVFDEIDAGIGGAVATKIGWRLKELSRHKQVIVVTHLAQVAAFADEHLCVIKDTDSEIVTTRVETLNEGKRVDEVARMLSGQSSETARQHARELFESAHQQE